MRMWNGIPHLQSERYDHQPEQIASIHQVSSDNGCIQGLQTVEFIFAIGWRVKSLHGKVLWRRFNMMDIAASTQGE